MKPGSFIWADLSTYNTATSCQFYKDVFGWEIENVDEYHLARQQGDSLAGIFETPAFLQKINMPHFWMSYFQVESTAKTVEITKNLNAKVEVDTTDFNNGKIALIRDPQGAGFTVYDGAELYLNRIKETPSFVQTELHVSDLQNVLPFYSAIFSWELEKTEPGTFRVVKPSAKTVILLKEIDNSSKGKFEYWVTTIQVKNLASTTQAILDNGGDLILREEGRNLMCDNSGEAFFYVRE